MSRGVANTLPVSLAEVANTYSACTTPFQTDTYDASASSNFRINISIPATAVSCDVRTWGGGGGGADKGGGGAGFFKKTLYGLVGGTSNAFSIIIGKGGAGSSTNASAGDQSMLRIYSGPATNTINIYATGGKGAYKPSKTAFEGNGGNVSLSYSYWDVGQYDALSLVETGSANGNTGVSTTGGNAGGVAYGGGVGGAIDVAGTIPGGGGGGSAGTGKAGANGRIIIDWYAIDPNKDQLVSFTTGANGVPTNSFGYSGAISATAPVSLLTFRGADSLGMANSLTYQFYNGKTTDGGQCNANVVLLVSANGYFGHTYANLASAHVWLRHDSEPSDTTLGAYFDVRVTKITGGNTSIAWVGEANNSWLNLNANRIWSMNVISPTDGPNVKFALATIEFRRNSDSVVLSSSTVRLTGEADSTPGTHGSPCSTCCFTPETLITMADFSTKPIYMVQVGDSIRSRSGDKVVTEVITRQFREMYRITFFDGRILNVSEDHPLFVKDKGYAAINPVGMYKDLGMPMYLRVGDHVIDLNGGENEIVSITDLDYPDTVYTFAESEFYANGMLVY